MSARKQFGRNFRDILIWLRFQRGISIRALGEIVASESYLRKICLGERVPPDHLLDVFYYDEELRVPQDFVKGLKTLACRARPEVREFRSQQRRIRTQH